MIIIVGPKINGRVTKLCLRICEYVNEDNYVKDYVDNYVNDSFWNNYNNINNYAYGGENNSKNDDDDDYKNNYAS